MQPIRPLPEREEILPLCRKIGGVSETSLAAPSLNVFVPVFPGGLGGRTVEEGGRAREVNFLSSLWTNANEDSVDKVLHQRA